MKAMNQTAAEITDAQEVNQSEPHQDQTELDLQTLEAASGGEAGRPICYLKYKLERC